MSNSVSKRDKFVKEKLSGWDKAIADAKKGITRMQAALEHAKEMKAAGEPWPGTQSSGRESRQQHSV